MSSQKKQRKGKKNQKRKQKVQSVQASVVQPVQASKAQPVQKRSKGAAQAVKKKSAAANAKDFLPCGSIRLAVFLSLSCFYMEIVFKLSVETLHTGSSFVFLALFSLCVGLIVSGIISLLPKKQCRFWHHAVWDFYLSFSLWNFWYTDSLRWHMT